MTDEPVSVLPALKRFECWLHQGRAAWRRSNTPGLIFLRGSAGCRS